MKQILLTLAVAADQARFALEPFTVERFVLMSSRPNVGGGPYVVEEAYPLAGAHRNVEHIVIKPGENVVKHNLKE